ncbi:hypothetical protein ADIS_0616 [Lunatimonas lonarensis]|uniref:Uncharacterized protein n=1 Tax=Lunatimonas lonarensis TaxID=1232681 RepID=R7ZXK9_9BACT|nr:hypothetical protein ADIS_0616 [Lunatimonas lonarensis]
MAGIQSTHFGVGRVGGEDFSGAAAPGYGGGSPSGWGLPTYTI